VGKREVRGRGGKRKGRGGGVRGWKEGKGMGKPLKYFSLEPRLPVSV